MDLEGIIQIGAIANSHGTKGEMKVLPLTDEPEIFFRLEELIMIDSCSRTVHVLETVRPVKKHLLIKLEGINDIETAKSLKGRALFTTEDKVRPLDEDEFYIHDLIHSKVYSTDGQYLGTIVNYFDNGPQGICEVHSDTGGFLFPTSDEILKEVRKGGEVVIQLIPELLTLNQTKAK
jgi:16S rRNA processing protein RimM